MADIIRILNAIDAGDPHTAAELCRTPQSHSQIRRVKPTAARLGATNFKILLRGFESVYRLVG